MLAPAHVFFACPTRPPVEPLLRRLARLESDHARNRPAAAPAVVPLLPLLALPLIFPVVLACICHLQQQVKPGLTRAEAVAAASCRRRR